MTAPARRPGRRLTAADRRPATAMLVADGRVALARRRRRADGAAATPPTRSSSWQGALVTPAFVDAHVHATDDRARAGRPRPDRRAAAWPTLLERGSSDYARQRRRPAIVLGHGWDETTLARAAAADPPGARPGVLRRRRLPVPDRRPLGGRLERAARGASPRSPPCRVSTPTAGCRATRTTLPAPSRSAPSPRTSAARPSGRPAAAAPHLGIAARARARRAGHLRRPTTSRRLLALGSERARARGRRLLGRARWRGARPRARGASARRVTCSPTARSVRTPRACAPSTPTRPAPATAT